MDDLDSTGRRGGRSPEPSRARWAPPRASPRRAHRSPCCPPDVAAEVAAFLAATEHKGAAGAVQTLPRPLREPSKVLLVGVGSGDEAGWRAAGAALARAAAKESAVDRARARRPSRRRAAGPRRGPLAGVVPVPRGRGEARGRARSWPRSSSPSPAAREREAALAATRTVAGQTRFARDLTNTPSLTKTPAWFVRPGPRARRRRRHGHRARARAAGRRGLRRHPRRRRRLRARAPPAAS